MAGIREGRPLCSTVRHPHAPRRETIAGIPLHVHPVVIGAGAPRVPGSPRRLTHKFWACTAKRWREMLVATEAMEATTSSETGTAAPTGGRAGSRARFRWPVGLAIALGAMAGVGGFTFGYAKGLSYFSTDPAACVNCHIMQAEFDGWEKGSHHAVAVCVDCHLPQAFLPKYLAKAENGWRHGEKFTTQRFQEPIAVQAAGLRILQDNCVRCHGAMVPLLDGHAQWAGAEPSHGAASGQDETPRCTHCHATVGHGARAGLGGPLRPEEIRQLEALPFAPVARGAP
jgi:cytochrome c nitrite reductase small subunit